MCCGQHRSSLEDDDGNTNTVSRSSRAQEAELRRQLEEMQRLRDSLADLRRRLEEMERRELCLKTCIQGHVSSSPPPPTSPT